MTGTRSAARPVRSKLLDGLGLSYVSKAEAVKMTSDIAGQLLGVNHGNRSLNETKVRDLAGAMTRGEWRFNGGTLCVSPSGRLIDGQHRLAACVRSGKPFETLLVVVPDAAQETMDQGTKRTFSDFLHMRGEPYSTTVAAVTNLVYAYEQDGVPSAQNRPGQATPQQKFDVLDRHPGIRDSVERVPRVPNLTHSLAATMHYLFSRADPAGADEFFRLLASGEGLSIGHPIHTLRERLLREATNPSSQLHSRVRTAFIVTAWNYWQRGEELKRLQFRAGGARPDRFPAIEGQVDYS